MKDDQFLTAGQVMSQMHKKHRFDPKSRRRITWDIFIALSAQENNALLVTENISDFEKIQNWVNFQFISAPQ